MRVMSSYDDSACPTSLPWHAEIGFLSRFKGVFIETLQ